MKNLLIDGVVRALIQYDYDFVGVRFFTGVAYSE